MAFSRLPVELQEMIIENVVPSRGDLAIPASDCTTQTLHSCLTLSKATFNRSLELLYSRCLYIDSKWRLQALLRAYRDDALELQRKLAASASMFLAPFSGETIEEPQVVEDLCNLFDLLGDYIRKMVIDMPLRSAYPDRREGREIRVPLRNAFRKLMGMEEFVSMRDELYLSTITPKVNDLEQPVWGRWPNLQRLALYNVDISEDLIKNIDRVRSLQMLVLTRPDGMEDFETLRDSLPSRTTIVIVNVWDDHQPAHRRLVRPAVSQPTSGGNATESTLQWSYTRDIAHYKVVCVRSVDLEGGNGARHIYDCEEWTRDEALAGMLWS